jgi:hypothetical protein
MLKKAHISNLQGPSKPNIIKNVSHTWNENNADYLFSWIEHVFNECERIINSSLEKTVLFLCKTVRLCHYYTINHCFPLFLSIFQIRRYISSPIWFHMTFSIASVYVKRKKWEIGSKGRDVTLFCCRPVARCCAPSSPISLDSRLSVVSVYVKEKKWEIAWKTKHVTLFCCKALPRCSAPSSPISFRWRLSVLSVYMKEKGWEIRWNGRDVTLFCCKVVARCCAPSSPIWLKLRLSVVSVYV